MVNIGRYNVLKVSRMVDFGAYLDAGDGAEILIPGKFLPEGAQPGDEIKVFVYTDSEDRLIATTERPFAQVGECAFLEVAQVNRVGAFLDWGLEAKQLLVPYSEQKYTMRPGGIYLVYVFLDDTTKRIVASTRVEKYLGNVVPRYRRGDQVKALVIEHTPIGYKCIVDNLHYGMIYQNETYTPLEVEQEVTAYVKGVREDCKIDLMLGDRADRRTGTLADRIIDKLRQSDGYLPLSDRSSPETIAEVFACSKKDFKKAIGHLYKDHKILIKDSGIYLPLR